MASLANPIRLLISKGPGLAIHLRFYVCGLQARPSVRLSSSRVHANDIERSRASGNLAAFEISGFRVALAIASLPGQLSYVRHVSYRTLSSRYCRQESP